MMQRENDENFRFFLTNKQDIKPINMLRHYKNRWNIEQYYRDQKQHLELKSFFLRERESTESYFNFVFWRFNVFSLYHYAMAKEGITLPIEIIAKQQQFPVKLKLFFCPETNTINVNLLLYFM